MTRREHAKQRSLSVGGGIWESPALRLWSIHAKYLDAKGLVACWRVALLAKAVLLGRTRGHQHHPQLQRFHAQTHPVGAINFYLRGIFDEASRRGYSVDAGKLGRAGARHRISVMSEQIGFELTHLRRKLRKRDGRHLRLIKNTKRIAPHPLFSVRKGPVESWEIIR